ncbi:hypothetical protein IWX49DRAFT_623341 [Phyllosticta citricarpa]|uniref:DNA/RNA-binding domain-containing protein n=1 Tax=Phyllosticta citricarpa TaxID=55181 RepID=A0ABR1MSR1_9PEZI
MNEALDFSTRYTRHLRAHPPPKAPPLTTSFDLLACPYCDAPVLFDHFDSLLNHVRHDHRSQISGSGLREGNPQSTQLLRAEALHKAKTLPAAQQQPRKYAGPHSQQSTPDINRLTLDASASAPPPPTTRLADDFARAKPSSRNPLHFQDAARKGGVMGAEHSEPVIVDMDMDQDYQTAIPLAYHEKTSFVSNKPPDTPSPSISESSAPPRSKSPRESSLSSDSRWPGLVLQPDSRPISQEQLAAEVKSIYAGLTMVESKCIHVDKAQAQAERDPVSGRHPPLAPDHWQALIALHRTLLNEHHDFFLASQHPSASPALRRLAAKYSMPARMWKHGIHSFLELLRHRLPESLEYMLTFIYLAYQMMALLYETVPAFEDTWIECLGDLGRYRMAIEDEDLRDRETWAGVARFWYSKAADKSPSVGRLYHHLAILARPHALQQLYFYCRSLTCVHPFMSARESIMTLFDPILGRQSTAYSHSFPVETSFVRAHGLLFERGPTWRDSFDQAVQEFTRQLDSAIGRYTSKWKELGAYIAMANIAGLFDYGTESNHLRRAFSAQVHRIINERHDKTTERQNANQHTPLTSELPLDSLELDLDATPALPQACRLLFDTLDVVLRRFGDKNVLTHLHVLLAFLTQVASLPNNTMYIFSQAQWNDLAFFLNTLARADPICPEVESAVFLREVHEDGRPLPEDYLIRGQLWAHAYYPEGWFDGSRDEEERVLELASTVKSRTERIMWLGIRLAQANRGLQYDFNSHAWSATTTTTTTTKPNAQETSPHHPAELMDVDMDA